MLAHLWPAGNTFGLAFYAQVRLYSSKPTNGFYYLYWLVQLNLTSVMLLLPDIADVIGFS